MWESSRVLRKELIFTWTTDAVVSIGNVLSARISTGLVLQRDLSSKCSRLRVAKVILAVYYFGGEQEAMSSDKSQKATSVN
jgi:hypothetical protein